MMRFPWLSWIITLVLAYHIIIEGTPSAAQQTSSVLPVLQGLTTAASSGMMTQMQLAYGVDTLSTTEGFSSGTGASAITVTGPALTTTGTGGVLTPANSATATDLAILALTVKTGDDMLHDMTSLLADFAMVDTPAPKGTADQAPSLVYFPVLAAPIVITYRLDTDTPSLVPLTFNLNTIARIYRGNITMWNDPAIAETNPSATLPARNITLFAQGASGGGNTAFVKTLAAADPDFLVDTGITLNTAAFENLSSSVLASLDGRLTVCSGYVSQPVGASTPFIGPSRAVINGIMTTPYSMGYAYLGNTQTNRVQVGNLVNAAGSVVQPNVAGAALAITEFKPPLNPSVLDVLDVSNPLGGQAWPITSVISVVLDSTRQRNSCLTKDETVDFIVWMLTSDVAANIATANFYTPMPTLFQQQFNLVNTISQTILCDDGSFAFHSSRADSSLGLVATTSQLSTLMTLFFNVHTRIIDNTVDYSVKPANAVSALQFMLTNEVDAGFTTPEVIAPSVTDSSLLREQNVAYKFLPAFMTGLVPVFNLDPRVIYATSPNITEPLYPLIITTDILGGIFIGQIYSWLDPRITRLNPGLAQRYRVSGVEPSIKVVICCTALTSDTSATYRFLTSINSTVYLRALNMHFPVDIPTAVKSLLGTGATFKPAEYEVNMAGQVQTIYGGLSYRAITSFTSDPTSEFQMLSRFYKYDDTTPIADIRAHALSPSETTLNSCAMDTFNPITLDLLPALSQRTDCYPLSYTAQAVVPASYSGDKCKKGNNTLALFKWLLNTPTLTASARQAGIARVTNIPFIHDAVINTLNYIKCDGVTMLITLPVIWSLTPLIAQFTYSIAVIGWITCLCTFIFMWKHRNTTVFRSASVPSMTLILVGICTLLAGAVALIQAPSIASCSSVLWLGVMGLTLTFAPLFMKTWRIYKIFDRKQLHVVKISNKKLNALIGAMLLFDLLILSIWQAKAPLGPVTLSMMNGTTLRQSSQCQASHDAMPFIAIIVIIKSILILFGALMGFTTRKVTTTFNESQTVAWSIYNLIVATIIIVPILIMVNATEDTYVVLQLFLVLWVSYCTLLLLFAPKILHILSKDDVAAAAEASSSRVSSNGFSFISTAGLTRQMLAKYIVALENQLHDAHIRMRELVGTGASAVASMAVSGRSSIVGGVSQLQSSCIEEGSVLSGRDSTPNRLVRTIKGNSISKGTNPSTTNPGIHSKSQLYVANESNVLQRPKSGLNSGTIAARDMSTTRRTASPSASPDIVTRRADTTGPTTTSAGFNALAMVRATRGSTSLNVTDPTKSNSATSSPVVVASTMFATASAIDEALSSTSTVAASSNEHNNSLTNTGTGTGTGAVQLARTTNSQGYARAPSIDE